MVSHQLVEQWRARLAIWQQRLNEGRQRPWLARAYVRVLSYLLAQYSPAADAERPLEMTDHVSRMLEAEGIGWQTQRVARKVQVLVRMADLERAKAIVPRHAIDAHDSPRWRHNTLERYRAWGTVIGLFLVPVPLAALLAVHRDSVAIGVPFCTGIMLGPCGLLAGHLWGIVATHKLRRCSARRVSRLRRVFHRFKVSP